MVDDNQELLEQPDTPDPAQEDTSTPKRSIPMWVWIVAAVAVVILLLGFFATESSQGNAWMLGLRSKVAVPSVVGQTESEAQTTLQDAGLRLGQVSEEPTLAVTPGDVASQSPAEGTEVKKDSAVDVSIATLPQTKVPDVVGETESNAITLLAQEGLRTGTIDYVYDSKAPAGDVTAQQPAASEEATVGSAVDLTVSKGVKQGQVPNVVGLSQDDANAVLTADGFEVATIKATSTSVPAGDVSAQSPAAGVVTTAGSTVTITVSTGAPASEPAPESQSESEPEPAPQTAPSPSQPAATSETPSSPEQPSTSETTSPKPEAPEKPAEPTKVQVPDVIGKGVLDAIITLRGAKLKLSFVWEPSEGNFLKVTKQDPESGSSVDPGTTVTITIGLPSISLPDERPTQPTPLPAPAPAEPPTSTQQPAVEPTQAPSMPTTP